MTPEIERLLKTDEASRYLDEKLGVRRTPKTLAKLRHAGGGPPFRKIGPRLVGYEPAALDDWARSLIGPEVRSTADVA